MTETSRQGRVDTDHLRDYTALRRSVTDRKIAGVAGGLGRHLNIDPTIIRVVLVVLCFFGGAGLLLYAAAWLFVPEEGKEEAPVTVSPSTRNAVLIVVGVVAALLVVGDSWGGIGFPWPLVLAGVAVLLYLVFKEQNVSSPEREPRGPGAAPSAPLTSYDAAAGPADPGSPGAGATTADATATNPAATGTESAHGAGGGDTTISYDGPPPWAPPPTPVPPPPSAPRKTGPVLFWTTLALVAIAVGVLGVLDLTGVSVVDSAYPALALTVIAVMLLVGSVFGRAGGLIALGVVASLVLAAVSFNDPGWERGRDVAYTPASAEEVRSRYSVPAGDIHLDLTDVRDLEALDGRTIELDAAAGELTVTVPDGVDALVRADISAGGEIDVDGERRTGAGPELTRTIDGGADAPQIELDLDLFAGSIEVNQR